MFRLCWNLSLRFYRFLAHGKKPLNDGEQASGHSLVPVHVHVEPVEAAMPVVIA
jgi:hypothetical protein